MKRADIKKFFSTDKYLSFILHTYGQVGCNYAGSDIFSSAASLIQPSNRSSATRVVIAAERFPASEEFCSSYKITSSYDRITSGSVVHRLPSFSVCSVMEEIAKNKDEIPFNVHGLCYNKSIQGLKAALRKINPIVLIHITKDVVNPVGEGFILEKTKLTNEPLFNKFKDNAGKVVLQPGSFLDEHISYECGGIVYVSVRVPVESVSSGSSWSFSLRDVKGLSKAVYSAIISSKGEDFRVMEE